MRRTLFLLTLALYGFSAMDMHEWVRVPHVIVHLLEHHSDLGHHDAEGTGHHHDQPGDHNPFGGGCHEVFCACGGIALLPMHQQLTIAIAAASITLGGMPVEARVASFSGNVWNPPKA